MAVAASEKVLVPGSQEVKCNNYHIPSILFALSILFLSVWFLQTPLGFSWAHWLEAAMDGNIVLDCIIADVLLQIATIL